eukprot:gene2493-2839_t
MAEADSLSAVAALKIASSSSESLDSATSGITTPASLHSSPMTLESGSFDSELNSDLNSLFKHNSLDFQVNQKIRCLGFDTTIEIDESIQKFFQYQIVEFESDTDILSITKQFDHFSQLILGRNRDTPVVIHECCYGLILASTYLIKYELFSLPQANDMIGFNDVVGTSAKHSHYQKVDSCTLIGDVTSYYYKNMTKRSGSTPVKKDKPVEPVLVETPKKKKGLLKKLFGSSSSITSTPTTQHQQPMTAAVSTRKESDDDAANTATGSGGSREDDLEVELKPVDKKTPPIIAPNWAALPEKYQDIMKKWTMKREDIERNWDVSLSLLHFQTKLPFYSSAENHASMEETRRAKKQRDKKASPDVNNANVVATVIPATKSKEKKDLELYLSAVVPVFAKRTFEALVKKSANEFKKVYTVKERVGKGGFGSVYAARNNTSKNKVALKKLPHVRSKERKFNAKEIRVLSHCKHPNIITYHESYMLGDTVWVAMEFMEGGTLTEASQQYPFQESNIAYVAQELLLGLHYLHSSTLVHRDLKSANIMMTTAGEIKLIDFGLCSSVAKGPRVRMCGSPLWMPPEMIQQRPHSYSADIWSLGICLLELANRNHRPHHKDPIATMFQVATEGVKEPFEDPNRWSDQFHDFIKQCLQFNASERPEARQLLRHPFIQQADTRKKMTKILSSIFLKTIVGI